MDILRSPRGKLLAACGLLFVFLLAPLAHAGAAGLARWLLAGVLLIGSGLWLRRSGVGHGRAPVAPPLQVTARAGLSPRCAVALVEVGGTRFLIAHGDGFAQIHPLPADGGELP